MKRLKKISMMAKSVKLSKINILTLLCLGAFLFGTEFAMASGGGIDGALGDANRSLRGASKTLATLIYAIGGIVGVIGGLRIFNKWNNGDQDINKELVGWGGAALFLFLAPTIMAAFFG